MTDILNSLYLYTTDDNLYIKKLDQPPKKLAINIKFFCAGFDSKNKIHICAIDNRGKLIHFLFVKNSWRKYTLGNIFSIIKNIKEMRLYILDNNINLFVVQQASLPNSDYRVNHLNFDISSYKVHLHTFKNLKKFDESIYYLTIDDLDNIIFSYYEDDLKSNKLAFRFNQSSNKWLQFDDSIKVDDDFFVNNSKSNGIQTDVFDYLLTLKYHI